MKLSDYYQNLNDDERERFAERIPTSLNNLHIHWIPKRKIPRKMTMKAIASASEGLVSYREVVEYFYFPAE